MRALYNRDIIQYNIKGEEINKFSSPTKASKSLNIHRDSIISCCKGKYKTAGGYVFKFKGEKFKLENQKKIKNPHICKICKSKETTRSMAMHLRFAHNTTTQDYISKYGEFRPKHLKDIQIKNKSNIKCEECGEKLKSNQHLMYHLTKSHPEVSQHDYIIKYIYKDIKPKCKCGCGGDVTLLRNGKNCDLKKDTYHRDYIKGHWDWEVFTDIDNQSKEELEILNYIKSIYKGEIQSGVRNLIPKAEIDIYLPELKLGIEYNGLYWHCEKVNPSKKYHIDKTLKCKTNNIHLIHIFSDEWYNKKEVVKSKLKHIINSTKSKSIYARKCHIKEIDRESKNSFLQHYHIQGKDRSKIHLGLFYKEDLVGVMTFTNPRKALGGDPTQKNQWELSRYATSSPVVGGASKLISHFIKTYSPHHIYSYSDNRWTNWDKNTYLTIGFKKTKISPPGYWYTKDFKSRIHRYNLRKHKLKEMGGDVLNKTESEIANSLGYFRVWDCGTTRYDMKIN